MAIIAARGEDPPAVNEVLHGDSKDVAAHGKLADELIGRSTQDRIPGDGAETPL